MKKAVFTYILAANILFSSWCAFSSMAAKMSADADLNDDKSNLSASLDVQSAIVFDISLDSSNLYLGKYSAGDKTEERGVTVRVKNSSRISFEVAANSDGTYISSEGDTIPAENIVSRTHRIDADYIGVFNPKFDGDNGDGAYLGTGKEWLYKTLSPSSDGADEEMAFKFTEQIRIPEGQKQGNYKRVIVFTLTAS